MIKPIFPRYGKDMLKVIHAIIDNEIIHTLD